MFGRLPEVGQWQRVLIRATQFTIIVAAAVALTALFSPQKFDVGVWLLVKQNPQRWIAGIALWLMVLLYAWTRQAFMVSRVVNSVFAHVRQYANDYDVLMRSVLRRNQFTPPEHINTLDELTRFISAMMQQAIRDQQQLTESTVALGEERLQRSIVERQTSYVRGGVSRVLHDGKDIHNDIIYLLEDLARSNDAAERERIRCHIELLQSRLLRIIHLQLSFQPGDVVRKGLEGASAFDLRQCVVDAYVGRLWRFFDGPGYETLTRSMPVPEAENVWSWRLQELCASAETVGALRGNPHDIWLCIDNMAFNAIDAMMRADQQQLQPLRQLDATLAKKMPVMMLAIRHIDDGNRVEISLRNRGPWIASELLANNKIWQLRETHAADSNHHRGRGIGLYCIKQIIDVGYGGDVAIENMKNPDDKVTLQLQLRDGVACDVTLYLSATESDNSPLIALGDASMRRTAFLQHAQLEQQDVASITCGERAAEKRVLPDATTVFVDARACALPRWYAVAKNDEVLFYPIDQRGVVVSLLIPSSKFANR